MSRNGAVNTLIYNRDIWHNYWKRGENIIIIFRYDYIPRKFKRIKFNSHKEKVSSVKLPEMR